MTTINSFSTITSGAATSTPGMVGTQRNSQAIGNVSPPSRRTPATPSDTVKLSTASQVLSMSQGGATASQIAASLGMTTAEVDQELGVSPSSNSEKSNEVAVLLS